MAVIITNMDMPKSCDVCPFMIPSKSPKYPFIDCRFIGQLGSVFNYMGAIPVECPLKSADEMIEELQKLRGCSCYNSDGIIDDVEDIIHKYCDKEQEHDK